MSHPILVKGPYQDRSTKEPEDYSASVLRSLPDDLRNRLSRPLGSMWLQSKNDPQNFPQETSRLTRGLKKEERATRCDVPPTTRWAHSGTLASVYSTAKWHQMMPGGASNDAPSHRARQRRFDPPFSGVWSTSRLYPQHNGSEFPQEKQSICESVSVVKRSVRGREARKKWCQKSASNDAQGIK